MLRDYEHVRIPMVKGAPSARPGITRNPARGFLHMRQEFVEAMADVGRLRWGASDFGPSYSGDVHHFDLGHHGGVTPDGSPTVRRTTIEGARPGGLVQQWDMGVPVLQLEEATGEAAHNPNDPEAIERRLNANGITVHSSGGCREKSNPKCTSLKGMRKATVDGIIAFRHACGQPLTITGGTEVGHAGGPYSHAKGYKVDIALDALVTKYIKDNYTYKGKRKDGARKYEDAGGNIFALESNHWDITFY